MINQHNEIEAKLAADEVAVGVFCKFIFSLLPNRYECITGPDTYYRQGENVVRHREKLNCKTHELTVKRRKSNESTRDREEIDLYFSDKSAVKDVQAFLAATGFEKEFKLVKTAHIFWLNWNGVELSIVIYDVWREENGKKEMERRYIEVEAEKGSEATVAFAKKTVNEWVHILRSNYSLREPLNESLYEIYSGKRYQLVK